MLTTLARRDREDRGFTLVELAGVILVIAILAAIAIPVFQLFQSRSRGAAMDATADNFNNSLIALSQQKGRSANDSRDLIGAYLELPQVTRDVVDMRVYGDDAADAGQSQLAATGVEDYEVIALFQRFGDVVRAGCLWLPDEEAAGEAPVYVRHGTQYEGEDVDFDNDGTPELVTDTYADISQDLCDGGTTPPADNSPGSEQEGIWDEATSSAGFAVAPDGTAAYTETFDDASNYDESDTGS